MPMFQVIAGIYIGQNQKVFKAGDKFSSAEDLDEKFANKFKRLDGPNKRHRDKDDSLDNSGRVMDDGAEDKKEFTDGTSLQGDPFARGFKAKAVDGARVRGEKTPALLRRGALDKADEDEPLDENGNLPKKPKTEEADASTKTKKKKKKVKSAQSSSDLPSITEEAEEDTSEVGDTNTDTEEEPVKKKKKKKKKVHAD